MNKIKIDTPLTDKLIQELNLKSKTDEIIIVFDNTKGLTKEKLLKLDPSITISIMGGLNIKKQKFNNEHYQKRTYYSTKELISIIDFFEKIERKINPMWDEFKKCMFVYKKICEYSNYEENYFNGKEASRNLLGVITGKSVCSGYAIIFKEAMDRLNIKCIYQNKEGHHSWNIVELNGNYYGVELTWDVYNKKNNECGFLCFCRNDKSEFYSNEHHDISKEKEEQEYDIKKCSIDFLEKNLSEICIRRMYEKNFENKENVKTCSIMNQDVVIGRKIPFLKNGPYENTFIKKDGSGFLIMPTNNSNNGVNEYLYIVYDEVKQNIKIMRIYSEMNLLTNDNELRSNIANNLLTEQRVKEKFNFFNGYVGFVEKGSLSRYYNSKIEESLNIHR